MKWDDIVLNARVYGLSAKYQFNATNSLALGYAILRDRTSQDNNADQIGLLYECDVSKPMSMERRPSCAIETRRAIRLPAWRTLACRSPT
ncbi:hypothetical protein [Paraburkholderia sediminicola]|uniref:hypothetical protein n=1 Tax=Paraburkholderia sediminicola TaxID=458836 RepID=UPI0038BC096F